MFWIRIAQVPKWLGQFVAIAAWVMSQDIRLFETIILHVIW
jgi:hypothetical protein